MTHKQFSKKGGQSKTPEKIEAVKRNLEKARSSLRQKRLLASGQK
jgi:hypothetical protein